MIYFLSILLGAAASGLTYRAISAYLYRRDLRRLARTGASRYQSPHARKRLGLAPLRDYVTAETNRRIWGRPEGKR